MEFDCNVLMKFFDEVGFIVGEDGLCMFNGEIWSVDIEVFVGFFDWVCGV